MRKASLMREKMNEANEFIQLWYVYTDTLYTTWIWAFEDGKWYIELALLAETGISRLT